MILVEGVTMDIFKLLNRVEKAKLPTRAGGSFDMSEVHAILAVIVSYTTKDYNEENQLPPELFDGFVQYLIRLDNSSVARNAFFLMIMNHDYMNDTIDAPEDVDGNVIDKYHDSAEKFFAKYGREITGA